MGLWGSVIIRKNYMSNGLTFELQNIFPQNLQGRCRKTRHYSCSQLPPALGVFRGFLTQFLINLHEILQHLQLFRRLPSKFHKIGVSIAKVRPFDMQ